MPNIALTVEVGVRDVTEPVTLPCVCNAIRDLKINTPAGLIAAPGNIPKCTAAEFAIKRCPVDSQLGVAVIRFFPEEDGGLGYTITPIYNMEPREDQLALLANVAPLSETPIYTDLTSRTESDYGLEFKTFGIPSILPPNMIYHDLLGSPRRSGPRPVPCPVRRNRCPRHPAQIQDVRLRQRRRESRAKTARGRNSQRRSGLRMRIPFLPTARLFPSCRTRPRASGKPLFNAEILAYDLETDQRTRRRSRRSRAATSSASTRASRRSRRRPRPTLHPASM